MNLSLMTALLIVFLAVQRNTSLPNASWAVEGIDKFASQHKLSKLGFKEFLLDYYMQILIHF